MGCLILVTAIFTAEAIVGGGFDDGYTTGIRIGTVGGVIYVAIISTAICMKKSLGFRYYIVALFLSSVVALYGTIFLGLIPAAFLTTRPNMMGV